MTNELGYRLRFLLSAALLSCLLCAAGCDGGGGVTGEDGAVTPASDAAGNASLDGDDGPAADACVPQCEGLVCGDDDGCGSFCTGCPDDERCDHGACVCAPQCDDRTCGDDGCGGTCGACDGDATCEDGQCIGEYPPEPYGTAVGDTIKNLSLTTSTGRKVQLKSFYRKEKVLVLISAAGW